MPRKAVELQCSVEEKQQLEMLLRSGKTERRIAERVQIVLLCHAGRRNDEIAKELGINVLTAAKWRKRFVEKRVSGLKDAYRSGKPKVYGKETRDEILKLLEAPPPCGQATWDGGAIAMRLKISDDIVWRILRKEGIQLQRMRSWCVSTDKEFASKAADVIGLYLNPPENALVLCVDEKPGIQALERKTGYVKTSSGKIVRSLKSTYKRNGTLNLFAALNVATGTVKTKTSQTKKRPDFQAFLDEILEDVKPSQEIHIILDNYCTHKKNDEWLKAHSNVFFHFTPSSASWLYQVEIWFGILTRKALREASFSGPQDIKKAIEDFTAVYHQNPKPFVWRKREVKGAQLKNTIVNLCN